jgi:hypothetical protein
VFLIHPHYFQVRLNQLDHRHPNHPLILLVVRQYHRLRHQLQLEKKMMSLRRYYHLFLLGVLEHHLHLL